MYDRIRLILMLLWIGTKVKIARNRLKQTLNSDTGYAIPIHGHRANVPALQLVSFPINDFLPCYKLFALNSYCLVVYFGQAKVPFPPLR